MSNCGSLNRRIYSGAWWGDILCAHAHSNDVSAEPHITLYRCVWGQTYLIVDLLQPLLAGRQE